MCFGIQFLNPNEALEFFKNELQYLAPDDARYVVVLKKGLRQRVNEKKPKTIKILTVKKLFSKLGEHDKIWHSRAKQIIFDVLKPFKFS